MELEEQLSKIIDEKIKHIKENYIETPNVQNITGATYNYYVGKVDMLEEIKNTIDMLKYAKEISKDVL